jgi:hypothetical protein
MQCPHCKEEIDVGLFTRDRNESVTNRSATEVKAGQRRARLDDANQSTRPNTVTVSELQKRGR